MRVGGYAQKHRDTPQFAIIGYGKLGGKELSYSSDLDLVYLTTIRIPMQATCTAALPAA